MRAKILMLLWRCWHLREDCIRNNGRETINGSVLFLKKYEEELRVEGETSDWASGKCAVLGKGNSARAAASPACVDAILEE